MSSTPLTGALRGHTVGNPPHAWWERPVKLYLDRGGKLQSCAACGASTRWWTAPWLATSGGYGMPMCRDCAEVGHVYETEVPQILGVEAVVFPRAGVPGSDAQRRLVKICARIHPRHPSSAAPWWWANRKPKHFHEHTYGTGVQTTVRYEHKRGTLSATSTVTVDVLPGEEHLMHLLYRLELTAGRRGTRKVSARQVEGARIAFDMVDATEVERGVLLMPVAPVFRPTPRAWL